jgi:anhydro-N-acetylmuramic acid kinase
MFKENYNVIGVMSGTSLDGIDLAYIKFNYSNQWKFEIFQSETVSYPDEWVYNLKNAIAFSTTELEELNRSYTQFLAAVIADFISKNNLVAIDSVCSHGHTILHQPQNGITLQIGNLPMLSQLLNQNIVCDFRVQDVALGGQGAPLVPIGDKLLFNEYDYCLNLGGFSNVSFNEDGTRIAFDISPVNTVLNFYANSLGLEYDDAGKIAKSGKLNEALFQELNVIDFYSKSYPKSLGMEFVNQYVFTIIETKAMQTDAILHTFVEHIAFQIARSLTKKTGKLLVTGGGAYNLYLLERMKFYLPKMEIIVPDTKVIEFKEALIFGFLGVLRLRNEVNVLSSVTGAKEDHSSGKIFYKTV